MTHRCSFIFLCALALAACGGAESDARSEGTQPGDCDDAADNDGDGAFDCDDSGCSGSPKCPGGGGGGDECTPNTTNGRTACADTFCEADTWCHDVFCDAGCQSAANCDRGDYCDKTGATVVGGAGVCRACNPGGGCTAQGNHRVVPAASNPEECPPGGTFTVTGTDAALSVSSSENRLQGSCALDASCKCAFDVDADELGTFRVELDFMHGTASVSASGGLCEYNKG